MNSSKVMHSFCSLHRISQQPYHQNRIDNKVHKIIVTLLLYIKTYIYKYRSIENGHNYLTVKTLPNLMYLYLILTFFFRIIGFFSMQQGSHSLSRVTFKPNSWLVASAENIKILYFLENIQFLCLCLSGLWHNQQLWKIFYNGKTVKGNFQSWDIGYFTIFSKIW